MGERQLKMEEGSLDKYKVWIRRVIDSRLTKLAQQNSKGIKRAISVASSPPKDSGSKAARNVSNSDPKVKRQRTNPRFFAPLLVRTVEKKERGLKCPGETKITPSSLKPGVGTRVKLNNRKQVIDPGPLNV